MDTDYDHLWGLYIIAECRCGARFGNMAVTHWRAALSTMGECSPRRTRRGPLYVLEFGGRDRR